MSRLLLLALSLLPLVAHAEAPKEETAIEAVVTAALDEQAKLDWTAYAARLHPESLKEFRALLVPVLEAAQKKGGEQATQAAALFGQKEVKTVLAWKPDEFFTHFMKASLAQGPLKEIYASTKSVLVGTVREGKESAHVVVRTSRKFGKVEMKRVEVVSLKRDKDGWKLTLGDETRGLAETLNLTIKAGVGVDQRTETIDPDKP